MAPQNFISPIGGIHVGKPFESTDIEVSGAIDSETAAFLVIMIGFVVALMAAL